MIQQRGASLLSSAERQLLRQNWQQNRQCLRCFHTSKQYMAEEGKPNEANDNGTPYNAPKRGPNRQERAAKVSSEISALAADLPKANLNGRNAEVDGAQPRNSGNSPRSQANQTIGPDESAGKEGPFAQALGTPGQGNRMTDPSAGGPSVMEPRGGSIPEAPATSHPNSGTVRVPAASPSPDPSAVRPTAPAKNLSPKKPARTPEAFLANSNTSTLLLSNTPGMVEDRINLLTPRSTSASDAKPEIQQRLRFYGNKLTAFRSLKEKTEHVELREKLSAELKEVQKEVQQALDKGTPKDKLGEELLWKRRNLEGAVRRTREFKPLPQTVAQEIINRMVVGKYDEQGLLSGKQPHKQPVVNSVAKELLRNFTYLGKDSDKFLGKLKSLLPAAAPAAAAKKPAAQAKA